MVNAQPTRAEIAAQLRALSRAKGAPVTVREYRQYPERLGSVAAIVATSFGQPWNEVLTACGIVVRDYRSAEQIVDYTLDFYHRPGRWPKARDFRRPCSHFVVGKVFRGAENAMAEAGQRGQRKLAELTANRIPLAEYLAERFITSRPQPLPAPMPLKEVATVTYGQPIPYALLPFAPPSENDVLALFCLRVGEGRLRHQCIFESRRSGRFPDAKAKEWNRARRGYVAGWIEFELRSLDSVTHGHLDRDHPCDEIVCWQNNWPQTRPRPTATILALQEVGGELGRASAHRTW
jgi:hypothetical protein